MRRTTGDDEPEPPGRQADRHPLPAHGGEPVGLAAVGEHDERVGGDGQLEAFVAVEPADREPGAAAGPRLAHEPGERGLGRVR
jgi:hypothetical protein